MVTATKHPDWTCCGTCEYWAGRRQAVSFGRFVAFEEAERAKCLGGADDGLSKGGNDVCLGWMKWRTLH